MATDSFPKLAPDLQRGVHANRLQVRLVELLLKYGLDVNTRIAYENFKWRVSDTAVGETFLYKAVAMNPKGAGIESVRTLCKHGADVDASTNCRNPKFALLYACGRDPAFTEANQPKANPAVASVLLEYQAGARTYFKHLFGACRRRTPTARSSRRVAPENFRRDASFGTLRPIRVLGVRRRLAPRY